MKQTIAILLLSTAVMLYSDVIPHTIPEHPETKTNLFVWAFVLMTLTTVSLVWGKVKPLLKKNRVVIYQSPISVNGVGNHFKTILYHIDSGEKVEETMQMVIQRDDPQGIGAAITYYRRYMVMSMLGLVSDDDNDAQNHRLATFEQKQKIVGAVKLTFPEATTPQLINDAIQNVIGKHPSKIREDEADNTVNLIKSYKD